jgi:hypothetical protein
MVLDPTQKSNTLENNIIFVVINETYLVLNGGGILHHL